MIFLNNKYYDILEKELQLSELEIKIFLLIINKGRMNIERICLDLNIDKLKCKNTIESLINKKIIIENSNNIFETFQPRFAIINRYKSLCISKKIAFKKNLLIDNLANVLEKPFDAARTKYG